MKKNLTELVFILDCSGSMHGLEKDTIGGFNSMIEKQKKVDGNALITTILFNHKNKVVHDRADVRNISPMTEKDYVTGGSTALLDTIGHAVCHVTNIHKYSRKEDLPDHTMFIITTDGVENSSHKYDYGMIRQLIELQKEKYGWEFMFLGANIDAIDVASHIGIDESRAVNFNCDSEGTELNYEVLSDAICVLREHSYVSEDWKNRIDNDFEKRGKSRNR
nr:vWA domain-containing protein [uncultured Shuttleworthia sp.]